MLPGRLYLIALDIGLYGCPVRNVELDEVYERAWVDASMGRVA